MHFFLIVFLCFCVVVAITSLYLQLLLLTWRELSAGVLTCRQETVHSLMLLLLLLVRRGHCRPSVHRQSVTVSPRSVGPVSSQRPRSHACLHRLRHSCQRRAAALQRLPSCYQSDAQWQLTARHRTSLITERYRLVVLHQFLLRIASLLGTLFRTILKPAHTLSAYLQTPSQTFLLLFYQHTMCVGGFFEVFFAVDAPYKLLTCLLTVPTLCFHGCFAKGRQSQHCFYLCF